MLPHRAPLVRAAGSRISNETAAQSLTLAPPLAGGGVGGGRGGGADVNATSSSLIRHDGITDSSRICDSAKGRSLHGRRKGDWMTFSPAAFDAEP